MTDDLPFPAPKLKVTRISWDEWMCRIRALPPENQMKIAAKAAEVVAAAGRKEK